MQCFVQTPSLFICAHRDQLLPEWSRPIAAVLIVLQQTTCDLQNRTPATEAQKRRLRDRFLLWGRAIAAELQHAGHLADLFDPKTGYPILSQPGSARLDDVAVVRACLGYPLLETQGCRVILHPDWGSAVYPSVLVSSAEPELLEVMTRELGWMGGSANSESWRFNRSENHHSLIGCGSLTQ